MIDDKNNPNTFYIPNPSVKRSLEQSKLALNNEYAFTDITIGKKIIDVVYINQKYRLTDKGKYLSKQDSIKKHFKL